MQGSVTHVRIEVPAQSEVLETLGEQLERVVEVFLQHAHEVPPALAHERLEPDLETILSLAHALLERTELLRDVLLVIGVERHALSLARTRFENKQGGGPLIPR